MSDHWNSLANLLGTPSLAPQKPKSEGAVLPKSVPSSIESEAVAPEVTSSLEATKVEKSRLKSSWDAVANFFGVASEPKAEPPEVLDAPVAIQETTTSPKSTGSRKSRPSMWQDQGDTPTPPSESPKKTNVRDVSSRETKIRELESDSDSRDDFSESREPAEAPERRSHRRPPRRGREATSTAEATSTDADHSRDREQRPSRSKQEDNRAGRSERRESNERKRPSPKAPPAPTPTRPASGFGAGIDGFDSSEEAESRDWDAYRETDFDNDLPSLDSESQETRKRDRDRAFTDEDSGQEKIRRSRRRGGRGKRTEVNDEPSQTRRDYERSDRDPRGDLDTSDDVAPEIRHSKIPSWTETIGVLVAANMENHEKSQGGRRGNPRGKGRR